MHQSGVGRTDLSLPSRIVLAQFGSPMKCDDASVGSVCRASLSRSRTPTPSSSDCEFLNAMIERVDNAPEKNIGKIVPMTIDTVCTIFIINKIVKFSLC